MTKDQVLSRLRATDSYISGEEISRDIGVTRAAVNDAVKTLRQEGYQIESSTRKGYHLIKTPDILSQAEILSYLPADYPAAVHYLEKTTSTNADLKDLADSGAPAGTVVIANEQSAGRGRKGRSFLSLKNKGIYFSYLLRPDCRPEQVVSITAWTAVAIANAIVNATGQHPDIKWVNDLQMQGKKICGILSEMWMESESAHIRYIIVGIGINVNQSENDFPGELSSQAGSIAMSCGHPVSRAAIAAEMIHEMDKLRRAWPEAKDEYLEEYRRYCLTENKDIRVIYPNETKEAHAVCVNPDFTLKVRYPDGSEEDLSSGEVSTRF